MSIDERPYQQKLRFDARAAMKDHRSLLIQLPTGGGKTVVGTKIIQGVVQKQRTAAFIVHRVELVKQTLRTFQDAGIPCGVIAAGYTENFFRPIQVCSIDTLRARIKKGHRLPVFDLLMVDECHHMAAKSWAEVLSNWPDAWKIGLSATPERADGRGLKDHFSHMINGPTTAWLIASGFLAPYKAFAPSTPDMSGVKTSMGDYSKEQSAAIMQKAFLTGNVVEHYKRLAGGQRAIMFCVSIENSKMAVRQFNLSGVPAAHLDGETDPKEREKTIQAFERGDILVLSNVGLFSEGFDVPAAVALIDLNPTQSLARHLQKIGRVLRFVPGKTAVIIDHAGNLTRAGLGFPDDTRTWSLDGLAERKKRGETAAAVSIKQCPECYRVHRMAPKCPDCNHVYKVISRPIEHRGGELRQVTPAMVREQKEREKQTRIAEMRSARTIEELVAVGKKRGQQNPYGWARHVMQGRRQKGWA